MSKKSTKIWDEERIEPEMLIRRDYRELIDKAWKVREADPARSEILIQEALELTMEISQNRADKQPDPEELLAWRNIEKLRLAIHLQRGDLMAALDSCQKIARLDEIILIMDRDRGPFRHFRWLDEDDLLDDIFDYATVSYATGKDEKGVYAVIDLLKTFFPLFLMSLSGMDLEELLEYLRFLKNPDPWPWPDELADE